MHQGGCGMSQVVTPRLWTGLTVLGAALCLALLLLFPAASVRAAVNYTGSVTTTDSSGTPQTEFMRGQPVYSNVELSYRGLPYDGTIRVELRRTTDGAIVSSFNTRSNNPVLGWNNGSSSGFSLSTAAPFTGDAMTYNVIAYYTGGGFNDNIAQTPIIVKADGLTIDPSSDPYYPGETVALKLGTSHTTNAFYVQIVNETDVTLVNWTGQIALTGIWSTDWVIPADFPDGMFDVNVRDATTHAYWYSHHFSVQKYILYVSQNRLTYLTGETAEMYYVVLDTSTFHPSAGVTIEYSAHWLDALGADAWASGSLPGIEGIHLFSIPFDAAIYADVYITYWANETTSGRSYEYSLTLYLGELTTYVEVSSLHFSPGEDVSIEVIASADSTAIQGAVVNISIELEGSVLPAYGAVGLSTGEGGHAVHNFALDAGASAGTYIVKVTVEKGGHISNLMTVFNVEIQAELIVEFDKAYYYSGDVALIRMEVVQNRVVVPGQSVTYIIATNMTTIVSTGQNNTGSIAYPIPVDFFGTLMVEAVSNLDGRMLSGFSMCPVILAELSLSAEKSEYSPGDRIVFNYEIFTNLASGVVGWEVVDATGIRVANGTPAFSKTGSFYYDSPTTWCSDSYVARVSYEPFPGEYLDSVEMVSKAFVPPITLLPFLRVDNPLEGAVTSVPVIKANGSTEQGILLYVNGFTVLTSVSGEFALNLPLLEGANLITITADNGVGLTTVTRNVTFVDPVPDIESQLGELASDLAANQASIALIWDQLNSTVGDVSAIWAQVNASDATLGVIWADVNATDAALGDLQAMIDALRSELTDVHSSLNGTDAGLIQLEASVDAMQAQLDSTKASLNVTIAALDAAQTQLDSVQADLDDAQADIGTKAAKSSVTTMFALAVVITLALAAVLFMLLRRKA